MDYTNGENNASGRFQSGDVGLGLKSTVVGAAWLNAIQAELCEFILARGMTLSKASNNQLITAYQGYLDEKLNRTVFGLLGGTGAVWSDGTRWVFNGTVTCPVNCFIDAGCSVIVEQNSSSATGMLYVGVHQRGTTNDNDKFVIIPIRSGISINVDLRFAVLNQIECEDEFEFWAAYSGTEERVWCHFSIYGYVDRTNS